jgi:luciferase family oxidoreductase group 1
MTPLSVLDLAPVTEGATTADALRNSLSLAQHAEALGFRRFWLAEHHNMPGIASAATAVVIAHIAGGTERIRVGSGGIMLPNHAPLVVAEQFGTLAALHPGRIDLGLGRAPGTDPRTMRALRRGLSPESNHPDAFPRDVVELQRYLADADPNQAVHAVPGQGSHVPLWLLGSSLYSAELAGKLGLRFAFASHFAPDLLLRALSVYRTEFKPSPALEAPYAMVATNIIAADTDAEAQRLATSLMQAFIRLRRGRPSKLPPPVDDIHAVLSPAELAGMQQLLSRSTIGSAETVARGLRQLIKDTHADEIIVGGQVFEHEARLRSYEIVAEVARAGL